MITSFLVYGSLALLLWKLGKIAALREHIHHEQGRHNPTFWTWEIILALFIFAFISGIRWQVGVDHLNYLEFYNLIGAKDNLTPENFRGRGIEFGYFYLTKFFTELNIHYTIYFAFLAFLQLFFVYYALKNERYLLPFVGIVIIFGGHYFIWMNGIRQLIAACMFVYSIQFIRRREFISYIATILIASTFHNSAIVLLLFYFIPQIDYFKNRYISLGIILASIYIGLNPTWLQTFDTIESAISFIGYESLVERADALVESRRDNNIGPRRLSTLLLISLIIWYSPKLKRHFINTNFLIYYNFTVLGLILYNLFVNTSHIFVRPSLYFTIFSIFTTSYLLCYLKPNKDYIVNYQFLVVLFLSLLYTIFAITAASISAEVDFTNYKFFFNHN